MGRRRREGGCGVHEPFLDDGAVVGLLTGGSVPSSPFLSFSQVEKTCRAKSRVAFPSYFLTRSCFPFHRVISKTLCDIL